MAAAVRADFGTFEANVGGHFSLCADKRVLNEGSHRMALRLSTIPMGRIDYGGHYPFE
jgi:hypothetical protein